MIRSVSSFVQFGLLSFVRTVSVSRLAVVQVGPIHVCWPLVKCEKIILKHTVACSKWQRMKSWKYLRVCRMVTVTLAHTKPGHGATLRGCGSLAPWLLGPFDWSPSRLSQSGNPAHSTCPKWMQKRMGLVAPRELEKMLYTACCLLSA